MNRIPVRQIDRVSWNPEVNVLTLADKELGLNVIRRNLKGSYRPTLVQWQFLEALTLTVKISTKFITGMVSQPK